MDADRRQNMTSSNTISSVRCCGQLIRAHRYCNLMSAIRDQQKTADTSSKLVQAENAAPAA